MRFLRRDAQERDLTRIVEIYNFAVASRKCSCDLEPTTVEARLPAFCKHSPGHRRLRFAVDDEITGQGSIGYLGFNSFMNERPGYFITADLAINLHPDDQGRGLGSWLLQAAIDFAPKLGIETLSATIFSSNDSSLRLFEKFGFERWGFMPRVARLEGVEKDLVLVGRRIAEPAKDRTSRS